MKSLKLESIINNKIDKANERDGVPVDKGVVLTIDKVENSFELIAKYCGFFTAYPDVFIDMITPKDSNFRLYPFQRIFIRACLRYKYHYCTAPRAFSKSFLSILAKYLTCIFLPGSKEFICAPGKGQGIKIAKEKITEIWTNYPLLKSELVGEGEEHTQGINFSTASVSLTFKNGSVFDIVAANDAQRGGRRSGGVLDETRNREGMNISYYLKSL